jgi:uncharacterized membrane protein
MEKRLTTSLVIATAAILTISAVISAVPIIPQKSYAAAQSGATTGGSGTGAPSAAKGSSTGTRHPMVLKNGTCIY